jgi:hypothetical protein
MIDLFDQRAQRIDVGCQGARLAVGLALPGGDEAPLGVETRIQLEIDQRLTHQVLGLNRVAGGAGRVEQFHQKIEHEAHVDIDVAFAGFDSGGQRRRSDRQKLRDFDSCRLFLGHMGLAMGAVCSKVRHQVADWTLENIVA